MEKIFQVGEKKRWREQRQGSKNMARRMRSPKKVARIRGWRVGKQDGSWKTLSNSKSETFSESLSLLALENMIKFLL